MSTSASTLDTLLAYCDARGIRLLPADDGELTVDAPRSVLTPALVARLKAHKPQLLAVLPRNDAELGEPELPDAAAAWHAALTQLGGDPLFPPEVMAALRAADVGWVDGRFTSERPDADLPGGAERPPDSIEPPAPCATCGGLAFRWDVWGEPHCLACEPGQSHEVLARVERVRRREAARGGCGYALRRQN